MVMMMIANVHLKLAAICSVAKEPKLKYVKWIFLINVK